MSNEFVKPFEEITARRGSVDHVIRRAAQHRLADQTELSRRERNRRTLITGAKLLSGAAAVGALLYLGPLSEAEVAGHDTTNANEIKDHNTQIPPSGENTANAATAAGHDAPPPVHATLPLRQSNGE